MRNVRYRGYLVTIPRSWPVYDLTRNPSTCVRFDRHALYLGTPSSEQRCPAHLVGRTEAILLEPLRARGPRATEAQAPAIPGLDGHGTSFVVSSAALAVTATWSGAESVVANALHRNALPSPPAGAAPSHLAPRAGGATAHAAGAVYTGDGFDACATPSPGQMSAWQSSYHAIGVYIGGVNEACAQPNLTAGWVSAEVADGWHLIPTYVGLQAPSNVCGCAAMTPSQAGADGAAAARSAVSNAASIGLPRGNPIYYDMEGYSRGGANTSAVLSFLSAWTSQLHADGYLSGVYSSGGSGITDLANQEGTGYTEPDDIWVADWNGEQTTSDPYVPGGDWSNHQRLHQYNGGHDETHGGVTLNIDGDYLDGATASTSSGGLSLLPSAPSLSVTPLANGTTEVYARWTGATGITSWKVLAGFGSASGLTPVVQARSGGKVTLIAMRNAAPYFEVQAYGSSGQLLGASPPVPMPAHISLFGPATFAPANAGLGSIPVACFTGGPCRIKLTLSAGRTVIARTGSENIGAGGGALLYYNLTPKGRALLRQAPGNRLLVRATARDASGASATMDLSMIAVDTTGRGPARHLVQSPSLRIVNSTAFVSPRGVGGVLAMCRNAAFCRVAATLKVGGTVIAHTGPEYLGANELGYVIFSLTGRGQALLRAASGNQLGAHLTISDAGGTATGTVALARFT